MVHFGFDSARIGSDEEAQIEKNASWMMENNAYLILTGHCDRVGPKDYNLWLGDRRARAVKARMIMNGVPEDRILPVISYGKSRPIDKRPGVKAMAMNRRVEFVVR
jgi:peptidoglycan-associated lipoprotein